MLFFFFFPNNKFFGMENIGFSKNILYVDNEDFKFN
jgi:hypothetical protein